MKKVIEHLVLVGLLIPLLFINIRSSHDWGDDFAQYIHQAKNIVSGIPQNETGYIFNDKAFIGPQAYPTGFPLILSSVVAFAGTDIYSLNLLMSVFLILSALIGYFILRFHTSYFTALFTTLIIAYNPGLLVFKTEILSDLPYTFFSLWCIYLFYKKESIRNAVLIGVLIGFSMHIRAIGFALMLTYIFVQLFANGFGFKKNKNLLMAFASMALVYVLLMVFFPCNTNYPISFGLQELWFNGNNQISYNFEKLTYFFRNFENPNFYYVGVIASSCLIGFALLGFLMFLKNKLKTPITIYFVLYVGTIILFQFGNAGIRFLFPVLIFIFLFAIEGLKVGVQPLVSNMKWLPVGLGVLVLFSYVPEIQRLVDAQQTVQEGPQTERANELFNFIKTSVDSKDVIAFDKPRALALYTDRKSVTFSTPDSYSTTKAEVQKFDVDYILVGNAPDLNSKTSFIVNDTTFCNPVFTNSSFVLYKIVGK